MPNILIVEDDININNLLCEVLMNIKILPMSN